MYYKLVLGVIPNTATIVVHCNFGKDFIRELRRKYLYVNKEHSSGTTKQYNLIQRDVQNCTICKNFRKQRVTKFLYVCYNLMDNNFCFNCPENIFLFDSLLRVMFSLILTLENGFLIHSAGVVTGDNFCELYSGPSSSGKSTLAKKFVREKVISDELCPVWIFDGKVYSYRSPFYSEVNPATENFKLFQVKSILFFNRSNRQNINTPQILSRRDAIKFLLKNIFFVLTDPNLGDKILSTVFKIIRLVRCYEI